VTERAEVELDISNLRRDCALSYAFFSRILQDDGWFDTIHEELCDYVQFHVEQALMTGKDCKIMLIMPRGSLKSTIMTRNFSIWMNIPKNYAPWNEIDCSSLRTLIATNTHPNARKKLEDIRGIYDSHDLFQILFPELLPKRGNRWTDEAAEINRKRKFPEATYEAAGMKTRKEGTHYNCIIEDDTVAPDESDTRIDILTPSVMDIDRAISWHRRSIPLSVPKGVRIRLVVTTRWAENDLVWHLQENDLGWRVFDVPAMDASGKCNFSMFYDREKLDEIQVQVGPYIFSSLYLNKPIDASLRVFQDSWFQYISPREIPDEGYYTISIDPAISEKDEACETAITLVKHHKRDPQNVFQYWIEALHGHFNPDETLDKALDLACRYLAQIKCIILETNAYQAALKYHLYNKMSQRGINIPVIAEPTKTNKNVRIQGLVPFFAAQKVYFKEGLDPQVESQLRQYPNGRLIDILDAFAMHYKAISLEDPLAIPKQKEPEIPWNSWDRVLDDIERKEVARRRMGQEALYTGLDMGLAFSGLSTGLGIERDAATFQLTTTN